jgi:carbamoyltransferase
LDWPWDGRGFADLYAECARLCGFPAQGGEQQFEALARLCPEGRGTRLTESMSSDGHSLSISPDWASAVDRQRKVSVAGAGSPVDACLAAALQTRIGELLVDLLRAVRERYDWSHLCLGGSLFYHSSINTAVKRSGLFADVFVPVDPGDVGLAVGTALHLSCRPPTPTSPFLGPVYDAGEIKEVLDNCKLQYCWESEDDSIATAVSALVRGELVGWFDGAMEWGPRTLGSRCILANPFSHFVLENLNRFLKRRASWRGYALSTLEEAIAAHFDGPTSAPFMECDYRPRDAAKFAGVLPSPGAAIRVHTVGYAPGNRLRRVLEAFGAVVGLPVLVNTSFNGFHEPIVCGPRDAVRVFYGSGLDLLVMDRFVLKK